VSAHALRVRALSRAGVLHGVSFDVARDEFVGLLGPSGAGKTSVLRLVAGLDVQSGGEIEISGRVVTSAEAGIFVAPQDRDIGMVFQSYALWPHLTVYENLAFPLRVRGWTASKIDWKLTAVMSVLRLGGLARRYPSELSGGQRQRVALGRGLVYDAKLILLDEPLANVDPRVREEIGEDLRLILKTAGATVLFVTHDQHEASTLCDRVILMNEGRIVQAGTPEELFLRPEHRFTAEFFGAANVIEGVFKRTGAGGALELPGLSIACDSCPFEDGTPIAASLRYADLELRMEGAPGASGWSGTIDNVSISPDRDRVLVSAGDLRLSAYVERGAWKTGQRVVVAVKPDRVRVFRL
jgi:ABC-type sugar transport system ATPase subunit